MQSGFDALCYLTKLSKLIKNVELLVIGEAAVIPLSEEQGCRIGVIAVLIVVPAIARVSKNEYVVVDKGRAHIVITDDNFPVTAVWSEGNWHWRAL